VAENATERLIMRADPERCLDTITDFEHYPEWAGDIKEVNILQRDSQGRPTEVAYRVAAFGRSTSYTLAYDYSGLPGQLSWAQTAGDLTSSLDGAYVLTPTQEGDTEVGYRLTVELKVPLPGFLKRQAEGRIMHTALRQLRARVELAPRGQ